MDYQLLDWDSGFFGMGVARITEPTLAKRNLADILLALKREGVKLAYWPSSRECEDEARGLGGYLVDAKTTFAIDLLGLSDDLLSIDLVEPYSPSMPVAELEELAVLSGACSRFALDPRIPRDKVAALYRTWMNRSLAKEMASEVLVIREGSSVVGVVTLGEKNGRGDIGLIAVDAGHRGRRYGEKLVRAAQKWFIENGYARGQVVTQGKNLPACRLYAGCGYSVEKVEYFYHFWL